MTERSTAEWPPASLHDCTSLDVAARIRKPVETGRALRRAAAYPSPYPASQLSKSMIICCPLYRGRDRIRSWRPNSGRPVAVKSLWRKIIERARHALSPTDFSDARAIRATSSKLQPPSVPRFFPSCARRCTGRPIASMLRQEQRPSDIPAWAR